MTDFLVQGATGGRMYLSQIVDSITAQTVLKPVIITDNTYNISFPTSGNFAYLLQPNQDCNITIENIPKLQFQKITLILQQPCKGNCYPSFPKAIEWENGKSPFINIEANKETILEIVGYNNKLKGRKLYG